MLNFAQINATRKEELQRVLDRHANLFAGKDLLEIGSGTGGQLKTLSQICKSAVGIDVAGSIYAPLRIMDIRDYDGENIPFPDRSFDVIFSSHVLEHIRNEQAVHREMHRVLRPDGVSINIVPTHIWKIWASIVHYPALPARAFDKLRRMASAVNGTSNSGISADDHRGVSQKWLDYLFAPRHGEVGNRLNEHWLFHPSIWRKRLEGHGWHVDLIEDVGLVYSGHNFLGSRVSMEARKRWAGILGSSAVLIILRPQ